MIWALTRYIEVPDCPTIPDHPAWWLPSIIVGGICFIVFCIAMAIISFNRWDAKRKIEQLKISARPDLELDTRLKKVESYMGGSGP